MFIFYVRGTLLDAQMFCLGAGWNVISERKWRLAEVHSFVAPGPTSVPLLYWQEACEEDFRDNRGRGGRPRIFS